jgi:hypothetical protein
MQFVLLLNFLQLLEVTFVFYLLHLEKLLVVWAVTARELVADLVLSDLDTY